MARLLQQLDEHLAQEEADEQLVKADDFDKMFKINVANEKRARKSKTCSVADESLLLRDRSIDTMLRLELDAFAQVGEEASRLNVRRAVALHESTQDKSLRRALRIVVCCNTFGGGDHFDKAKTLDTFKHFRIDLNTVVRERADSDCKGKKDDIVSIFLKAATDQVKFLHLLRMQQTSSDARDDVPRAHAR